MLVECLTDNRNRAASDVRVAITRNGGRVADPGSVAYLFSRKGVLLVDKTAGLTEDDVLMAVLDAGAEDVSDLDEAFEVQAEATDLHAVRAAVTDAGLSLQSAEIAWMPSVQVPLEEDAARKVLKLVDALEDLDDVQNIWFNADIPDSVMEAVEA
jgi:YebC/PmpR family DNA-binding regulatory protein